MKVQDLLEGQTAVITGGSSGNGRSIAIEFAKSGADVVIADIQDEPRLGGVPTHIHINESSDSNARFVECDVTKRDDLVNVIEVAQELGGLNIMVNNAGIFRAEEFLDVTEAEYQRIMDVNVKGTFFGSQIAAEYMLLNEGGNIINLSSVGGLRGTGEFVTYCTSKAAVRVMTYALADKLGPEIRVNAIHPGVIDTAMTTEDEHIIDGTPEEFRSSIPARRFGKPEDVANIALFLASDLASYVTGESIIVDGGMFSTG